MKQQQQTNSVPFDYKILINNGENLEWQRDTGTL